MNAGIKSIVIWGKEYNKTYLVGNDGVTEIRDSSIEQADNSNIEWIFVVMSGEKPVATIINCSVEVIYF